MSNLRKPHEFCPKCGAKPNEYCKHSSGRKPPKDIQNDEFIQQATTWNKKIKNPYQGR